MKKLLATIVLACLVICWMPLPAQGGQGKIEFKLAHSWQPSHAISRGVKLLAKLVEERTNGNFIIHEFPANQLGSEKDLADSLVNNIIQMSIIGPGEMGKRYKPMLIFDAPYLFRDYDHVKNVLKSDIGRQIWDGLEKAARVRQLDTIYYGVRHVTANKAIHKPADLAAMKMRTPDQPINLAIVKAMGANPTPMAFSEVYLGLQQRVVDAQENPIPSIYTMKFFEVQTNLSLTGHMLQVTPVFVSNRAWNQLPDEYKTILAEAVNEAVIATDADILREEKEMLAEMESKGLKVNEVDIDAFRQATKPVISQFESTWGAGLFEKIQAVQ